MDFNMNDRLTAYELAKQLANDDSLIIELMNMENQMGIDVPDIPCNRGEAHNVVLRDSYPEAQVHGFNQGVGSAASQTRSVTEGLMMASVYSVVDKRLADESGNANKYRAVQAEGFVLGMGRQRARQTIYASKKKTVNEIDGLYTRLKAKSNPHVIEYKRAGASPAPVTAADNPTSVYVCALGRDKFHFIHSAQFGSVGVKRTDRSGSGGIDWEMPGGKRPAYVELFETQFGIAVEHPDAVFRIANVPTKSGSLSKEDREKFIDIVLEVQNYLPMGSITTALYGNLAIKLLVEKAAREKQVTVYPEKDSWGNPVSVVNDMRVRRMDIIKSDELL
jgi:hypothetical protein